MSGKKADKLATYRAKRHPAGTPEPFGAGHLPAGGNRFVVQLHQARARHYDLRLEVDGVLCSFAVPKGPCPDPAVRRLAIRTEDHPLDYADFEGIIPEGNYGAGAVIVWDQGRWQPIGDVAEAFESGKLLFDLHGVKLHGRWTLVRTRRSDRDWLLIKERDRFVQRLDTDEAYAPGSVLSGLTVEGLAAGEDPAPARHASLRRAGATRQRVDVRGLKPMLATPARPFTADGWYFELKYDGYRVIAVLEHGQGQLRSRAGNDLTTTFPDVAAAVARLPFAYLVLDGEVVVHDSRGLPSFGLLQQRAGLRRRRDVALAATRLPATLYAFDLLAVDDFDLRALPLSERKAQLRAILPAPGLIRYSDHQVRAGEAMFRQVEAMQLEGIMAKRADSPYVAGRSDDWRKITVERHADCVVLGYTEPEGAQSGLGALLLGQYLSEGGELRYVGRVGTGWDGRRRDALAAALARLPAGTAPPNAPARSGWHWCRDGPVCEVRYKQYSREGLLRQPVFVRLREDKPAPACVMPARAASMLARTVEGEGAPGAERDSGGEDVAPGAVAADAEPAAPAPDAVRVTNRDKVFWPEQGHTKGDLIAYYRAVAPWLLPYLRDRPLVLTRFPDGIDGKSFFQKDAPAHAPPWVRRETLWSPHAERELHYFIADDEASLAWIVNLGTIPLHVWSSRVGRLDRPDWSIIDLDPKGAPFTDVVTIARFVHDLCEEAGLASFVKTTGSTGLHILLPLGGALDYEQSRALAELLARIVVAALPSIATIARAVEQREHKVYVDYLQNGRGRLLVAPYSVRPLPGAPVSMPIAWQDVRPGLDTRRYRLDNALRRLRALRQDPWQGLLTDTPDLARGLERLEAHWQRGGRG